MTLRPFIAGALIIGLVLIGGAGVAWAVGSSYSENVPDETLSPSETLTQNVSGTTVVDTPEYALSVYDNETVRNSSGSLLLEGDDYDWYPANSTVRWYTTNSTSDGASATLNYSYTAKISEGRALKDVSTPIIELVIPSAVLLALTFFVVGLALGLRRVTKRSQRSLGR